jgi:hypothetical protein
LAVATVTKRKASFIVTLGFDISAC